MKALRIAIIVWMLSMLFACNRNGNPLAPVGPATLTVRVLDAMTQQPIVNARVSVQKDGQNVGFDIASDATGAAVFTNLPGGDGYKAFANNIPGYSPGASPSIQLIQNMEIIIAVNPSLNNGVGLVAGSVKDRLSQKALPGVTVSLLPAGGGVTPMAMSPGIQSQAMRRPSYATQRQPYPSYPGPYRIQQVQGNTVQTDQSGQFTFNDVQPGVYQVRFQLAGYREEVRETIQVNPGNSTTIETVFLANEGAGTSAGNVLIVEATRVMQLNREGKIVWNYQSPTVSSAVRLPDGNTIVAEEFNNDVKIISPTGEVLWNMGRSLGLISRLNQPGWVAAARDGQSFLITDTGNNRVIEVQGGAVVWEFNLGLNRPRAATYASNGNIVIADTGNRRVIEITREGQIAWSYLKDMMAPVHALRLADGNTIITDAGYNRVVVAAREDQPAALFYDGVNGGADPAIGPLNRPRSVNQDTSGNLLVADTGNNRILEITPARQVVNAINSLSSPLGISRL